MGITDDWHGSGRGGGKELGGKGGLQAREITYFPQAVGHVARVGVGSWQVKRLHCYLSITLLVDTWFSFQFRGFMHSATVSTFVHLCGGQMGPSLSSQRRCWLMGNAHVQLREKTPHEFAPVVTPASTCIYPAIDDISRLSCVSAT